MSSAARVLKVSLDRANRLRQAAYEAERVGDRSQAERRHGLADKALRSGMRAAELVLLLDELGQAAERAATRLPGEQEKGALRRWRLALWALGEKPSKIRNVLSRMRSPQKWALGVH